MDNGLVLYVHLLTQTVVSVLILVVVDNGLELMTKAEIIKNNIVLILIVVDNGLVLDLDIALKNEWIKS